MNKKHHQETYKNADNNQHALKALALIFFCFVAAVLGSALVLVAQDDINETITTNNRERIVSREGQLISDIASEVGESTVAIGTISLTQNSFFGEPEVMEGDGTGIIVSGDGYVVTNRHVIPEGVGEVNVTLSNGKNYKKVKVIGRDQVSDIAFLKIESEKDLPAATLGNSSEMEVGEKVIAIGNALGTFRNTVTTGVLSGVGRPIVAGQGLNVQRLENLLQTDAAINPGNSGGPLVNLSGEVIGINTAVAEGAEGIGFAIPIDDIKGLVASVKEKGELIRPYVGVRTITLTDAVSEQLDLEVEDGAYVLKNGVVGGSPADKTGIRGGDIIIKVEDQTIDETNAISSAVSKYKVGEKIELTIIRDGNEKKIELKLEEFPGSL